MDTGWSWSGRGDIAFVVDTLCLAFAVRTSKWRNTSGLSCGLRIEILMQRTFLTGRLEGLRQKTSRPETSLILT